jgi:putative ABC transport system ATP-binding protein
LAITDRPSPNLAIAAHNVTLTLGSDKAPVEILRGLDLEVHANTSVALLGPSGSGKSSLMAVLAGLERASGGTVQIAGLDFATMNEDELARARRGRIGIVLQAFHLLPTMTALENVAVPLELAGIDDPFGKAAAELTAVGLGHRLTHYPAQLSGGEQHRVAIARAMASSPDIIFADEPTGNLDTATGQAIIDLIFTRRAALGSTLLIITHDPELAKLCDRIVVMHDGQIQEQGALL